MQEEENHHQSREEMMTKSSEINRQKKVFRKLATKAKKRVIKSVMSLQDLLLERQQLSFILQPNLP